MHVIREKCAAKISGFQLHCSGQLINVSETSDDCEAKETMPSMFGYAQ